MCRPQFNPFIVIWVIPNQNKKMVTQNWLFSDCWLEVQSAPAATGLWTGPQTAGEIVSLLSVRPVYVFFYQKREEEKNIFLMIFDSNYFQAIQRSVFYKKSTFKMFKCNFVHVSRPIVVLWPKQKWKLRKSCHLKSSLPYLIGWHV